MGTLILFRAHWPISGGDLNSENVGEQLRYREGYIEGYIQSYQGLGSAILYFVITTDSDRHTFWMPPERIGYVIETPQELLEAMEG